MSRSLGPNDRTAQQTAEQVGVMALTAWCMVHGAWHGVMSLSASRYPIPAEHGGAVRAGANLGLPPDGDLGPQVRHQVHCVHVQGHLRKNGQEKKSKQAIPHLLRYSSPRLYHNPERSGAPHLMSLVYRDDQSCSPPPARRGMTPAGPLWPAAGSGRHTWQGAGAGARCKVQGARCKVQGARCKVQGARCKMQGAVFISN